MSVNEKGKYSECLYVDRLDNVGRWCMCVKGEWRGRLKREMVCGFDMICLIWITIERERPNQFEKLKVRNILSPRGRGLVVSMLAFYYDDPNSNPPKYTILIVEKGWKRDQEAEIDLILIFKRITSIQRYIFGKYLYQAFLLPTSHLINRAQG